MSYHQTASGDTLTTAGLCFGLGQMAKAKAPTYHWLTYIYCLCIQKFGPKSLVSQLHQLLSSSASPPGPGILNRHGDWCLSDSSIKSHAPLQVKILTPEWIYNKSWYLLHGPGNISSIATIFCPIKALTVVLSYGKYVFTAPTFASPLKRYRSIFASAPIASIQSSIEDKL